MLERVGGRFTEQVEAETGKMTGIAAQITGGAAEVASMGEAFGLAVQLFSQSNDKMGAQLQRIEAALGKSIARSDEQLAYYVAQAREVIDLSIMSQKQIVEDLQQLASRQAAVGARRDARRHQHRRRRQRVPVWAVFGDLMSGLLGAFVLILVGVLVVQMELVASLNAEVAEAPGRGAAPHGAGEGPGDPAGLGPRHGEQRTHRHQRQRAVCLELGRVAARRPAGAAQPSSPLVAGHPARATRS